jgi:hypothetical protein
VEIVVVLTLLAMSAIVVLPTLTTPRPQRDDFGHLVLRARQTAIARAQVLALDVDPSGTWTLRTAGDSAVVARGSVDDAIPERRLLRFTPTGACMHQGALPAGWAAWDVARCRPVLEVGA